jgi:hypothetical protein
LFVCTTKIRKSFEIAIQKSEKFTLFFDFLIPSPYGWKEFSSVVLAVVYGCHLMIGLSGESVTGQRHDGLNKEIRSVPRSNLGGLRAGNQIFSPYSN